MRRGVVLHLLAGGEVVLPGRQLGRLADPVAAAEGGQGRIGELEPGLGQLLVHARETALALAEQPQDVLAVLEGLLGAREARHLGRATPQDVADGGPGHLEGAGDGAHALPAALQLKDRVPDPLLQHRSSSSRRRSASRAISSWAAAPSRLHFLPLRRQQAPEHALAQAPARAAGHRGQHVEVVHQRAGPRPRGPSRGRGGLSARAAGAVRTRSRMAGSPSRQTA